MNICTENAEVKTTTYIWFNLELTPHTNGVWTLSASAKQDNLLPLYMSVIIYPENYKIHDNMGEVSSNQPFLKLWSADRRRPLVVCKVLWA